MENILVSIVIPTYGRPHTLERAVKSVLNQTYTNIEVLVVDDNNPGTDARKETEEVMGRLKASDERVIYLQHPCNKNGSAARNTGIFGSHGKYVALLDDDDEFKPDKISVQLDRMEKLDNTWAACVTGFDKLSEGKLMGRGAETKEGNILLEALGRNYYACSGSNLFIRRSVLDEIQGFNESFKRNQDLELLVRILQKYKVARCEENSLIIHAHKRTTEDVQAMTDTFLNSFTPIIEKQAEAEKKKIYFLIYLQLVRYYIIRKKNISKAYSVMREHDISLLDLLKYFKHLFYRYRTKKICGYPLKKQF